ncbi:MAG TPA: T9SS type A sorting domain-containing protein [bacterium]|nr:T9SS type A sorting domain-containing protein [bacterium]
MKTTFPLFLCMCLVACGPATLLAWGLDIPIWTEGQVRCFDADYAIDGTMFVVFQPEDRNEIHVYESRNRGYSWSKLLHFPCYHPIRKIKMVVHDEERNLILFFREPNPNSQGFGKLVCTRLNWEEARTWTTVPALVHQLVSPVQIIENSFDVCLGNNNFYAAWLEDVNAHTKRLRVLKSTFSAIHLWTDCYNETFNWTAGSGTRVSIDVNPRDIVCVGYCGYEATGYHVFLIQSPDGGSSWESASSAYSASDLRYDPNVAAANVDDLTAWVVFNADRGGHQIGLVADCITTRWLPSEIWITDTLGVDEYVSDIENYRVYPNEYVNLLYIRDNEGLDRTLYWLWASASDPHRWLGKTAVNDRDITSWPEDVAPKLVYSPGNWASGGGAVFSYANRFGLFFDAPWNVTSANLMIVTVDSFLQAIQPLLDWKNETGIQTYVVDYLTLADGRDSAERIKKAIDLYYRNHGVRHVLLLGDSEIIPTRYTLQAYENGDFYPEEFLDKADWGWNWSGGDSPTNAMLTYFLPNYFATDLYYADLYDGQGAFHTWDENHNGYFAEMYKNDINPEHIDVYPEVAVGRVPASNVQEVENYVNKVIRYESSAFRASWFHTSYTLANMDWDVWIHAARKTATIMETAGFENTHREHPKEWAIDPSIFVNGSLNGMGFLLYNGHGPGGMGGQNDWRVCGEKLPVVFHAGCGAGNFTPNNLLHQGFTGSDGIRYHGFINEHHGTDAVMSRDTDGTPPLPDPLQPVDRDGSYSEFLICKHSDRGAIVYYGANTGMQNPGQDHGTWFFEAFTRGHRFAGDMWKYAVSTYCREHAIHTISPYTVAIDTPVVPGPATVWDWVPVARFHQTFKYTLFGDPTLRVGGIPVDLSKSAVPAPPESAAPDFVFIGNYPNPFNSATMISMNIPQKAHTKLVIYNLNGQQVCRLIDQVLDAGEHRIPWRPGQLPSAVYIYQLRVAGKTVTGRLVYLK